MYAVSTVYVTVHDTVHVTVHVTTRYCTCHSVTVHNTVHVTVHVTTRYCTCHSVTVHNTVHVTVHDIIQIMSTIMSSRKQVFEYSHDDSDEGIDPVIKIEDSDEYVIL